MTHFRYAIARANNNPTADIHLPYNDESHELPKDFWISKSVTFCEYTLPLIDSYTLALTKYWQFYIFTSLCLNLQKRQTLENVLIMQLI